MPDPSGINPLVGRVLPAPAGPTFDDAVTGQLRYEALTQMRRQRVQAAQDAIAQKEAQAHLTQVLQSSMVKDAAGHTTYDRGKLTEGFGVIPEPILKMLDDSDKSAQAFQAAQSAHLKDIAGLVAATGNNPVVATFELHRAVENGAVPKDLATSYLEAIQRDPSTVEKITDHILGKDAEAPKVVGSSLVGPKGNVIFTDPAQAAAQKRLDEQAVETARHNKATEANAAGDLALKQQAANPFGQSGAPATPQAATAPVEPGQRNTQALESLPANVRDTVRLVGDYKIQLPSGMALRTPYWQGILDQAAKYNPSFDATQYNVRMGVRKDFTSGKTADAIAALNTAVGHLDTLQQDAIALNSSDFTPYNTLRNMVLQKTGDSRPGQLVEAANALAMELTKAYRGAGGSEADIEKWRQSFDAAGSPGQLKDNINQAVKLLGGLLDSIRSKYERGMGEPANFGILNPKAQSVLDRIAPGVVHDLSSAGGKTTVKDPLGIR